uniref:Peptidase S9 prolyl oligopeptidase catalytic domain-containing protein n=1 Tax=Kwoniella pini CBS 10737 TaxID=1296096 RepID=A0A1B9I2G1_9TREE|nr:uncharacterized protein I206_04250 [Kwoniella pini CBS 10737]OCF49726.1 hypothetical protein I206_04250 [Kwoniella pini CBS 10737]
MREHPLINSPLSAFLDPPIDPDMDFAFRPYDEEETWPSEIGKGGKVGWKKFKVGNDGTLEISYPEIRWDQLRSDHGWASLQYQCILRSKIIIPFIPNHSETSIRIDVIQGVEYAFIPSHISSSFTGPIQWYNGDIYAFAETPIGKREITSKTSNFARSLSFIPGEYVILLKAIYEIRMFGDPAPSIPIIKIKIVAELDDIENLDIIGGLEEVPDIVDGWFMGNWISVGIRVPCEAESIEILGVDSSFGRSVNIALPQGTTNIINGQTRPLTLKIEQITPLPEYVRSLDIKLKVKIHDKEKEIVWHPTFKHLRTNNVDRILPFKITFASPSIVSGIPACISHAMIVPPPVSSLSPSHSTSSLPPVLLVLHGAGVDITQPEYIEAVPFIAGYWAILSTGRNEWGEDWHGSSMLDVWAAREAFGDVVKRIEITVSDQTITKRLTLINCRLMGHSNGGQGAWHLAARYPDRIQGVVAASGWLTIQDYVPYTETISRHFADPSLIGILSSSLSAYSNDLYLSNLVDIPILVIHGSEDDNVPPRHSRSYVQLISSWAGQQASGSVKLIEIPKKGHWWDDVLRLSQVMNFIENLPRKKSWDEQRKVGFTLTTANPQESGGRAGIRIVELDIPGRIGRLDVNARQWKQSNPSKPLDLRGMNIKRIELISENSGKIETLIKTLNGWKSEDKSNLGPLTPPRTYGPLIRILSTNGPMIIICPNSPRIINIAKKISHDLYLFHRLDCEIIDDKEGLIRIAKNEIGQSNLIIIGRPDENLYTNWMIRQNRIPLQFPTKGVMLLKDKVIYDKGAGIITLHPHPTSTKAISLLIAGNDELGLELVSRLFPIRTGIPIPDWAIINPQSRWKGSGGLIGAGFWNDHWGWNETMSWMDR